jgi:predicted protein tyrosine phosphatase
MLSDIAISSLNWARRHKRDYTGVITIEDPMMRHGLRFHRTPHPDHLILSFVDLDVAMPSPYDRLLDFRLATMEQVADGLAFARKQTDLLVHCQAGISRSTALALAIWMERLGDETLAFAELARVRPNAVPNRHVIELADKLLRSNLSAHIDAWDARNAWNPLRRRLNRRAYLLAGGFPLDPD